MADDLIWMSAYELGSLYRRREVSPVEVVDAVLDQLEKVNPAINAFVTVTADQARTQAVEAEKQFVGGGEGLPPLMGIPITVKDLTDTAGVRTTYGSPAYADHVPTEDGLAWARLKAAGTIMIGKTTTPEFGLLGVTESHLTGTTGTPWNPAHTSGGSSGGAAASVAAGIAPLAWGSDGGGSIRVPASCCGVVGFKPSIGRIPFAGDVDGDTTEGPLTRRVVDAALLLDVTVGPHRRDRLALPATGDNYTEVATAAGDLAGLRIAVRADSGMGPIDPATRSVFAAALDDLRAQGAFVDQVEMELPDPHDYFVEYWGPEYIDGVDQMIAAGDPVWPALREIADMARGVTAQQASAALRETKTKIYDEFERVFRSFDLLVSPTTPTPPFPHAGDKGGVDVVAGQRVRHAGLHFHSLTEPPSHAGVPAISVLCGFTEEGLPVGLQIMGPLHADAAVVSAAARYERAAGWWRRHPAICG